MEHSFTRRGLAALAVIALSPHLGGCGCDERLAICDPHGLPPTVETVSFSQPRGVYRRPILVAMTTAVPDASIYYTLDGSAPTPAAQPYLGPLVLDRTTVVRAATFPARPGDKIATHTFVFGGPDALPVLSVSSAPAGLFDQRVGIHSNPSARGDRWERPASFELLPQSGLDPPGFQLDAGLRIHGEGGRERSPKKSFEVHLRRPYGAERLHTRGLFDPRDEVVVRGMVLRAGYFDSWLAEGAHMAQSGTLFREQVARDLFGAFGQPSSRGTFVHLYLNGVYWGVYNLCEAIDAHFLEQRLGEVEDGWDLVGSGGVALEGDTEAWRRLERLLEDAGAWEAVAQQIDLPSLIDHLIFNVWVQNYAWPGESWLMARPRVEGGRWSWLAWDVEHSFGGGRFGFLVDHDTLSHARDHRHGPLARLIDLALAQPEVRRSVAARWAELSGGALETVGVQARYRDARDRLRGAIAGEAERWGRRPDRGYDVADWLLATDRQLNVFVPERARVVEQLITPLGH